MPLPREYMTLRVSLRGNAVDGVQLLSERAVHTARVLSGRPVAEVLSLIPLLFALCGRAQAEAANAALDDAAGRSVDPAERGARNLLVAAEAVDQHLQALLTTWPRVLRLPERMDLYLPIRRALRQIPKLLHPAGVSLGAGPRSLEVHHAELKATLGWVRASVLGLGLEVLAQAVLARLEQLGFAELGKEARAGLKPLEPAYVRTALDASPEFAARPSDREGRIVEVGPFATQHAHPSLEAVRARYGAGVWTRYLARHLDLEARLTEVETAGGDLVEGLSHFDTSAFQSLSGEGLGRAQTARGPLFHRVHLEKGQVARWAVLAPTEWTLHPNGPVQGLSGVSAEVAEPAAEVLLTALDPCVPFRVVRAD